VSAQQSVQWTLGILRPFQAFSYVIVFGLAVPASAQVMRKPLGDKKDDFEIRD